MVQTIQCFQEIERELTNKGRTTLSVLFPSEQGLKEVVVEVFSLPNDTPETTVFFRKHVGIGHQAERANANSLETAFACVKEKMQGLNPLLDSVGILGGESTPRMFTLVRKAWAQTYGLEADVSEFTTKAEEVQEHRAKLVRDSLIALLRKGEEGVRTWNSTPETAKDICGMNLSKLSFSGLNLSELELHQMNLEGTNFDGITMRKGHFVNCKMQQATFRNAILNATQFAYGSGINADFTGASLVSATFYDAAYKKAIFKGAKMSGSTFMSVDLCGADLTDADMSGVKLDGVKVDETTKFPSSLTKYGKLIWKGKGNNPYIDKDIADAASGVKSTEDFIKFLENTVDRGKLDNAIKMLKKERFQLFSDHGDKNLSGVVRSQTDASLVYGCTMDDKGNYSCATQNLFACGGLKGSLCKHLLVLIIGLVNADVINPSNVANWCAASTACKPKKNDEVTADLFLKYKGAESGEIDWRPTETMPEDYYAF